MPETADVVVVGAGLVGLCTALSLCRRGAGDIVVADRGSICGESSGASAGGLWSGHECLTFGESAIVLRASEIHASLSAEFACDYLRSGLLQPVDEADLQSGLERVERTREAGFEAQLLSPRELAECEPLLRGGSSAVHFPQDGSIHPLKLAAALTQWLRRNGVKICLDQAVHFVEPDAPAIVTASGRTSAESVIVAAGAWTPLLTKLLGWSPPIRPIRGTLLATEAQSRNTLRSVVIGRNFYFWQLACGPLAGGGSEEDVGFREGVEGAVVGKIRHEFSDLFPALSEVSFTSRWFGFRPFCQDMRPVIGRVPGLARVFVSAGHFRKGILLAPLSGELLADEVLEGRRWVPAESFRPERFSRAVVAD